MLLAAYSAVMVAVESPSTNEPDSSRTSVVPSTLMSPSPVEPPNAAPVCDEPFALAFTASTCASSVRFALLICAPPTMCTWLKAFELPMFTWACAPPPAIAPPVSPLACATPFTFAWASTVAALPAVIEPPTVTVLM